MRPRSRRSLLAGTAGAVAVGTAGCLDLVDRASDGDDENTTETELADDPTPGVDAGALPAGVESLLAYLYDTGEGTRITLPGPEAASGPAQTAGVLSVPGDLTFEWRATLAGSGDERETGGHVGVGSFQVNRDSPKVTLDGRRGGFDVYVGRVAGEGEVSVATDGDVLLAGSLDWVDSTLSHHESGETPLVDARSGVRPVLAALTFRGPVTLVDEPAAFETIPGRATADDPFLPDRFGREVVRTDDAIVRTVAAWYPDGAAIEEIETAQELLSTPAAADEDPTVELRAGDRLVVATGRRSYTPPEARPQVPGPARFDGYDETTGQVRFRLEGGDDLPAEHLELEIDHEEYDGDWARGQDEVGAGDGIAVAVDAVEPGDYLLLSYDPPDGEGGERGNTVLSQLPFDLDFDPDARAVAITYGDGPPLEGDRLSVVLGADDRRVRPWNGQLRAGDTATVSDLPKRARVHVEYALPGAHTVQIGGGPLPVPGHFDVQYDGSTETLTIEYPDLTPAQTGDSAHSNGERPDQEPLDASRYEIRLDGEPADRQWADVTSAIQPGDTLALEDVAVDTNVTVQWRSDGGEGYEIARTLTLPDVEFSFDYDAGRQTLTVRHAGGQEVRWSRLGVHLFQEGGERTVGWNRDGTVAPGDEFVVEDVPPNADGSIVYRDRYLARVRVRESRSGE